MAFTEDFTPFFADFGVPAALAGGVQITVIHDRAHIAPLGGGVDATEPMALAKASDVAANAIAFRSAVAIGGVDYTVRSLQPDGTGLTLLLLELA